MNNAQEKENMEKLMILARDNSHLLRITSVPMPFDQDYILYDISYKADDEQICNVGHNLLKYFQSGISILAFHSQEFEIIKKGMSRLYEFHQDLLEVKQLDEKSKKICQLILRPCAQALENGKFVK